MPTEILRLHLFRINKLGNEDTDENALQAPPGVEVLTPN